MSKFTAFPKIDHFAPIKVNITQKIHGTNAQIRIYTDADGNIQCQASSRTRNITPADDNFGFAHFVHENRQEIIEKLGVGTHFGEWAGPKINSGEGLDERVFVLFDHFRHTGPLPKQMVLVPLLYSGPYSLEVVDATMTALKEGGSRLVPGFMRPEGIVLQMLDRRFKKVFQAEETQWKQALPKAKAPAYDGAHLMQPIRLEKLLSRDERYSRHGMRKQLVNDYFQDLVDEQQVTGTPEEILTIKKAVWGQIYNFVAAQAGTSVVQSPGGKHDNKDE